MNKFAAITILCLFFVLPLSANKFWLTTKTFPHGPKIAIAGIDDQTIVVAAFNNIYITTDGCDTWNEILTGSGFFSLHTKDDGTILAGGSGKIFFSTNYGQHWDSVSLNTNYVVGGFAHTSDGGIFAITGNIDIDKGFVGAGVYFSSDNGKSWVQKNNGLNAGFLSCDKIVTDQHDNLYLAIRDELSEGKGGLFISTDRGNNWQQISIKIDGKNAIYDDIKPTFSTGLSMSPDDSLYYSFEGVSGSVAVRLNISKSINDLKSSNFWNQTHILEGPTWWMDRTLNDIYFANSGDKYSSFYGSLNIGGTFFMKAGKPWDRVTDGLGVDINFLYNVESFFETSTGKIFMVQYTDEKIYWADTSSHETIVESPGISDDLFEIYPNPSSKNSTVSIHFFQNPGNNELSIIDLNGNELYRYSPKQSDFKFLTPSTAGTYFVNFKNKSVKIICD